MTHRDLDCVAEVAAARRAVRWLDLRYRLRSALIRAVDAFWVAVAMVCVVGTAAVLWSAVGVEAGNREGNDAARGLVHHDFLAETCGVRFTADPRADLLAAVIANDWLIGVAAERRKIADEAKRYGRETMCAAMKKAYGLE